MHERYQVNEKSLRILFHDLYQIFPIEELYFIFLSAKGIKSTLHAPPETNVTDLYKMFQLILNLFVQ
jgi:hypothetical protein